MTELDQTSLVTRSHLQRRLGSDPSVLMSPRGYGHLALAVIDAVFSLNVRYGAVLQVIDTHCRNVDKARNPGKRSLVASEKVGFKEYPLSELADRCAGKSGGDLADSVFGSRLRTPGARTFKADAVAEATTALLACGVDCRQDLLDAVQDDLRQREVKSAWTGVRGLAATSWRYLLSLSGVDEIKPDRMITGFVEDARAEAKLGSARVAPDTAADALIAAGRDLYGSDVSLRALDHTVWRAQSGRQVLDNPVSGPSVWTALQVSDQSGGTAAYEYALYGEAHLVGGPVRLGPVELVNALNPGIPGSIASGPVRASPEYPVAFLRLHTDSTFLDLSRQAEDLSVTPPGTDAFVGGGADDEACALLSLGLGVRLRSGGLVRVYKRGDRLGHPMEVMHSRPYLPSPAGGALIPRLVRQVALDEVVPLLHRYRSLPAERAIRFARAARSYQSGIWVADDDPTLAWLRLVAAIEVMATGPTASNLKLLADDDQDLVKKLSAISGEAVELVADKYGPLSRSGWRFRRFILDYKPDPPSHRPPKWARVPFNSKLGSVLRTVYDHRSRALHDATPFPPAMCLAASTPLLPTAGGGREAAEKPIGLGSESEGGWWDADETPISLATFEYLVRGSMLRYLESLNP